jgi:hypothetical protein
MIEIDPTWECGDSAYDLDEIMDGVDPDWLSWLAIWAMFD